MEQNVLIQEIRNLFNQACERAGAGQPEQAKARLEDLRDLLNKELPVEEPEPKPEPPSEPVT